MEQQDVTYDAAEYIETVKAASNLLILWLTLLLSLYRRQGTRSVELVSFAGAKTSS